jgi:hypothetical protein
MRRQGAIPQDNGNEVRRFCSLGTRGGAETLRIPSSASCQKRALLQDREWHWGPRTPSVL